MDDPIPYTNTGPAILNKLAPTPRTNPSLLYSIAGATIELANPVIGIIDPAPALFPIKSYTPNPVKKAPININVIEVAVPAVILSRLPTFKYKSFIICPITQIIPPTKNASV